MSTTNGYSQTTQSTADQRVLITGASSGIGLELAREFARNGHPLVITATGEAELDTVARDLTESMSSTSGRTSPSRIPPSNSSTR
jgi:short-subunit dehydrogenase